MPAESSVSSTGWTYSIDVNWVDGGVRVSEKYALSRRRLLSEGSRRADTSESVLCAALPPPPTSKLKITSEEEVVRACVRGERGWVSIECSKCEERSVELYF